MGNTGVDLKNPKKGAYHVHDQMWDPAGNRVNPTDFWDRQGPADPNPAPPAHLGQYQQYLQGPGANASNGFGNAPGSANMPAPGSPDAPSDQSPSLYVGQVAPRLGRRISRKPGSSFFDTSTPAVPFAPSNDVLSAGRQNPFDNRFGNWATFPAAPPNELSPSDRRNFPGDRFGNWTSSPDGSTTPRNPNLPVPPPEPGRPLGIFSGKPMPLWSTLVPLGGLLNNSKTADNNAWFNLPVGLGFQDPTPPAPPLQTGSKPERSLGRVIVDPSQASVAGMHAPAAPLAPYDDPDYSGGLLGGFALARLDLQNPDQPAPPTTDDERDQAKLQALEDKLTSTGDIRDAVALYNARKAIRARGIIDQA